MRKVITSRHYELKRLKKIASLCQPGTVLDIGFAQHPNPFFSSDLFRVGIDLDKPKVKTGYEEEIVGDASRLDMVLGNRQFDNIVAGEFLEHLERPYDFLRSLLPYLKNDGKLILSTPNPVSWPCVIFEWGRSRRFYFSQHHTYYFSPRWVERILESTGYVIRSVGGVGFFAGALTFPCPPGLSYQVIFVAEPARSSEP